MSELAATLAAVAGLNLTRSHARCVADLLRERLDSGTLSERAAALIAISDLEARAAPAPSG